MASRPPLLIRDVAEADLGAVFLINQQSIPAMNSLTMEHLRWFAREAEYFRVAEIAAEVAGFLICLPPEAPYGSPNLRWLKARYEDFLYIDRVAVSPRHYRRGVATALYMDAARRARDRYRAFAC